MSDQETALAPLPIDDPAIIAVEQQAQAILAEATGLEVSTKYTQDYAVAMLGEIATIKRTAEARRDALVRPHNQWVKGVNELVKRVLAPVEEADGLLRGKDLAYRKEQQRIADEQRRAAEAEARRQAEEAERARREADRLAQEAARLAREAAQEQDRAAAAILKAEADAAHAELMAAQKRAAEAIEQAAKQAPAIGAAPRTVDTGMGKATVRRRWTFEVTEPQKVPREFMTVNPAAIQGAVHAGVREIPGCRIFEEESLSVAASRR